MSDRRSVGVVFNPTIPRIQELVTRLVKRLGLGDEALVCSVQDLEQIREGHPGVDLLITVGGDGTILRAAHITAPHGVAILGINMGRVGFMTELSAQDAIESVGRYLDNGENGIWVEERAMLQAQVVPSQGRGGDGHPLYHALNEAVVGSSAVARMATIEVTIGDAPLTVYRADSVIVATATGSTGYAFSAGGPIMHPLSHDILLKPVAAHRGLGSALVIPSTSRIGLTALFDGAATLSVDGFLDMALAQGDQVVVEASPFVARFLRAQPPSSYYAMLTQRLGLEQGDTPSRATF